MSPHNPTQLGPVGGGEAGRIFRCQVGELELGQSERATFGRGRCVDRFVTTVDQTFGRKCTAGES